MTSRYLTGVLAITLVGCGGNPETDLYRGGPDDTAVEEDGGAGGSLNGAGGGDGATVGSGGAIVGSGGALPGVTGGNPGAGGNGLVGGAGGTAGGSGGGTGGNGENDGGAVIPTGAGGSPCIPKTCDELAAEALAAVQVVGEATYSTTTKSCGTPEDGCGSHLDCGNYCSDQDITLSYEPAYLGCGLSRQVLGSGSNKIVQGVQNICGSLCYIATGMVPNSVGNCAGGQKLVVCQKDFGIPKNGCLKSAPNSFNSLGQYTWCC